MFDRGRHLLSDNYETLILVESYGFGFVQLEMLPVVICKGERFVVQVRTVNLFHLVAVKPVRVLESLRNGLSRRTVPFQLDDHRIPLVVYAEQVDVPAKKCRFGLDDQ